MTQLPADIKAPLLAMLEDDDVRSTLREVFGVERREKEIRELKEEVAAQAAISVELKEEVAAQKTVIRQQEERLSELEQYSRRNCLNFTGVPEVRDENAMQLALDLAKMADVKLDRADIDLLTGSELRRRPPVTQCRALGPGDQLLLYQLAKVLQVGTIAPKEAYKKIGPLNHAR